MRNQHPTAIGLSVQELSNDKQTVDILWLSHVVPYPPNAGLIQRSYYLLRELARRHSVTLLAFNQRALMSSFYDDADDGLKQAVSELQRICNRVEVFDIVSERRTLGQLRLAASSLISRNPYSIRWLESARFAKAVTDNIARGTHLLHVDTISLAPYRQLAVGVPAALNHHNIESHLLLRRAGTATGILRKAYYWQEAKRLERFERRLAPRFQLHLTCSELDSERLRAVCASARCEVVPNGVDTEFFRPTTQAIEKQTVTFVASMGWSPNRRAAEVIAGEIWPAIAKKWPDARFLLVGAHAPRMARDLAAVDSRFEVTGFVEDVRPYLARATVFLCPISDGGGTKLKLLNALAMGKAVVAHPVSCEGLDVAAEVHVLQATTTDDYVAAISRLFEDEQLRKRLGSQARDLVEARYGYSSIGQQLSGLYEETVESGAA